MPAIAITHDVLCLHVAVDKIAAVDCRQRHADFQANGDHLCRRDSRLALQPRGDRFSLDQVGPEADLAIDALRAVDLQNAGMIDLGHLPCFAQQVVGVAVFGIAHFQCNGAIQHRIERAIDHATAAAPDFIEHFEVRPQGSDRLRTQLLQAVIDHMANGRELRGYCSDVLQAGERRVIELVGELVPVHRLAVGNVAGNLQQQVVMIGMHSSTPRVASARAPPSCVPRSRWVPR